MAKIDYVINYETMLIETADHPEYLTKILDVKKGTIYSKRTPKSLMKEAAFLNNLSIKGHLDVVNKRFPNMKKIPLMINPNLSVIMIPTTSPSNANCKWINYIQIDDYFEHENKSKIIFRNGEEILLPITYYVLDKQVSKATKIIGLNTRQHVERYMLTQEEKLQRASEFVMEYIQEYLKMKE